MERLGEKVVAEGAMAVVEESASERAERGVAAGSAGLEPVKEAAPT